MSWLSSLSNVYDNLFEFALENPGSIVGLNPVATISQNAQVEMTVSKDGQLLRASLVGKDESQTIVPVTASSAGRTSGPIPHPIFDNLEYLAGDIENYLDEKWDKSKRYDAYIGQLKKWLDDDKDNQKLNAVYSYLSKGTLTEDLINKGVLELNEDGFLDPNVKIQGSVQKKFFIRIAVEMDGCLYKLWEDMEFIKSCSEYYVSQMSKVEPGLCYVTGDYTILASLHGKNIRKPGDQAKLISSNDKSNYTFRGKFREPSECVGIGYLISEKAHSALRYLIKTQAYKNDGYTVLAYSTKGSTSQPFEDTKTILEAFEARSSDKLLEPEKLSRGKNLADKLREAIECSKFNIDDKSQISLIAMDNAVPGRLAIQYYKEMSPRDYFENIMYYHSTMAWAYLDNKSSKKNILVPKARDVINYAFGTPNDSFMAVSNKKFMNKQLNRLLPCIVSKARIPRDFLENSFRNATAPLGKSKYSHMMCINVCCGIARKYYLERGKGEYGMALNKQSNDRSYLYGRLLAVADALERSVLTKQELKRPTNAIRYMNAMTKRPYVTWLELYKKLIPYIKKLESKEFGIYYNKMIEEIINKFDYEEYQSNKPLEATFVLGFYTQKDDIYTKKISAKEEENDK